MKLISVVIPVYNEESNINNVHAALRDTLLSVADHYRYEIIFVDDGSVDASIAAVQHLIEIDPCVKGVVLTRNFGKEVAITAGIEHAAGDAVIVIDADLQHPPALIPQFLQEWEKGSHLVIGVRKAVQHSSYMRRVCSILFSRLMNSITDLEPAVLGATDFRLMDRIVVREFVKLREHRRLTRSLIDWLGFRRAFVEFDAGSRKEGGSHYSYRKLVTTALGAIVSNSRIPLSFAGYLGCIITFFAGLLGLFIIIEQFLLHDPLKFNASGTAMIAVFILFLNGIVLMCLGLTALYIGTIHEEVINRPLYVVEKTF